MFNQPIEKDTKIFTLKSIKTPIPILLVLSWIEIDRFIGAKMLKLAANNGQVNSDFAANSKIVASSKIATSSKIAARIINCGIFPMCILVLYITPSNRQRIIW